MFGISSLFTLRQWLGLTALFVLIAGGGLLYVNRKMTEQMTPTGLAIVEVQSWCLEGCQPDDFTVEGNSVFFFIKGDGNPRRGRFEVPRKLNHPQRLLKISAWTDERFRAFEIDGETLGGSPIQFEGAVMVDFTLEQIKGEIR